VGVSIFLHSGAFVKQGHQGVEQGMEVQRRCWVFDLLQELQLPLLNRVARAGHLEIDKKEEKKYIAAFKG